MVKIKWSSFHLMLVIEACFQGSNDCFYGTVNSLMCSKLKNVNMKAAASIVLSCWQRWYEGFRTSWSMCFKILAVIGSLMDLQLLLRACSLLAPFMIKLNIAVAYPGGCSGCLSTPIKAKQLLNNCYHCTLNHWPRKRIYSY